MRFVVISDTHGRHKKVDVPDGDVFVFAGDMCKRGNRRELEAFRKEFLSILPHEHKVVVAGNHDYPFEREDGDELLPDCTYLEDEAVTIDGVKIYGSPWQPEFCNWAFNLPRGEALRKKWDMIPDDTDVLVTHGPPKDIMDGVPRRSLSGNSYIKHVGCEKLRDQVGEIQPKLHVFGHIHEHGGVEEDNGIQFANVSFLGEGDAPYVFEVDS